MIEILNFKRSFLTHEPMNWYLAKLVYQVVSGAGNHAPQFDEQWRLIAADEIDWAREKAFILGQIDGFDFLNTRNEKVQWKFVNVVDVCELSALEDGAQLYSVTEEPADVNSYLEVVEAKAKRILEFSKPN